jgi:hypothetical protein
MTESIVFRMINLLMRYSRPSGKRNIARNDNKEIVTTLRTNVWRGDLENIIFLLLALVYSEINPAPHLLLF